ncbi:MAG TPA: ABC transporter ATP-binding protein [Acidimicrobiia bacterium]|nr:ABC transporter ATP-binding protein [Acidimicrobiia bacterium]
MATAKTTKSTTRNVPRTRAERKPAARTLLRVKDLKSGYGSLPVLHGISFEVNEGETVVLLGLNGAGKTTTGLNLCGAVAPWSGTIEFDDQDVTKWNTHTSVNSGIVMVPEGRRVFPDLVVEKNLEVGAWSQRKDSGWLATQRERVFDYFPRLRERREQLAGTLSGGEQQMLAIARGLMARPKLLIIDEASLGLAPVIVKDVFSIVRQINDDGVTVILIEQNIGALEVADVGLVMEQGTIVSELRGNALKNPTEVRKVFLG